MFTKILLPTDGSEVSLRAAGRAIALARLADAPLHVVFVLEPYPYTGIGEATATGLQEYLSAGQRTAAEAFRQVAALCEAEGVRVTSETVEGHSPAERIVQAAKQAGADVIVMASHGRTGVARALLGSVAAKVVALAPMAVMVLR